MLLMTFLLKRGSAASQQHVQRASDDSPGQGGQPVNENVFYQIIAGAIEGECRREDRVEEAARRVECDDAERDGHGAIYRRCCVRRPVTRFQGHYATDERDHRFNDSAVQHGHLKPCLTRTRVQGFVCWNQMKRPERAGIPIESDGKKSERKRLANPDSKKNRRRKSDCENKISF